MASNKSSIDLQRYMRAVGDALRAGNMANACRIGDEAVLRGFENEQLLTLAAYARAGSGDESKALELALRARALAPRSVDVLTAVASCYSRNGMFHEAAESYEAALKQSPGSTELRFRKACALEDMSEVAKAKREFERVLDSDPRHAEALTHLANLAAQRGDAKSARDFAARALKNDPRQSAAVLALASADIEEKKFDDALAQLRAIVTAAHTSPLNRSIAHNLMGDALDGLERYAEAFGAYSSSKAAMRDIYRSRFEAPNVETASMRVSHLENYFRNVSKKTVGEKDPFLYESPVRTHVFLVGFPRSGTTLIEQILATHPEIAAMEERDCLIEAATEFTTTDDGLDRLMALSDEELAHWRDVYWSNVSRTGISPSRPVFVDKMPLNTVLLCLIAKLFPGAKILFALRDPRDVVLSCFRRRFGMNAQMYELITLKGAAEYYDAVMRLAKLYREKLDLDIRDLRYEAMIADMETEMRAVCAFLGVEWDETMRDFATRARERSIDTPSAAQVSRGLYAQGAGQWRRYAEQLKPILPVLQPWIAHYGYTE